MNIRKDDLFSGIEFLLLLLFILYSLWFQYTFFVFDGFLSIIGICMVAFYLFKNNVINLAPYKNLKFLLVFIIYALLFGFFLADRKDILINLGITILKNCIPMVIFIDYVGYDKYRYRRIMKVLVLAGGLLSFSAIQKGTVTANGGLTLGELNANVLSSYLILSEFAILVLFSKARIIERLGLGLIFVLCFVAVFNSASRRGALTVVSLFLVYLFLFFVKEKKNKVLFKVFVFLITIVLVFSVYSRISVIVENSSLFTRLLGGGDVVQSDYLRKRYQSLALKMFIDSPIFGHGLGSVGASIGMHSHSLYAELLACTGCIGMLFFSLFLLCNVSELYKLWRYQRVSDEINTILTIVLILLIMITGVQVTYIYDSFFYLMVAVILCTTNIVKKKELCLK